MVLDIDHPDFHRSLPQLLHAAILYPFRGCSSSIFLNVFFNTISNVIGLKPKGMASTLFWFLRKGIGTYFVMKGMLSIVPQDVDTLYKDQEWQDTTGSIIRRRTLKITLSLLYSIPYIIVMTRCSAALQKPLLAIWPSPGRPASIGYLIVVSWLLNAIYGVDGNNIITAHSTGFKRIGRFIASLFHKRISSHRTVLARTFLQRNSGGIKMYTYSPLQTPQSLRLLKLERINNSISCDMVHTSIGNSPPYEAISYRWGDPTLTHVIAVGPERLHIPITSSCRDALSVRTPLMQVRYLWIDSICINQLDKLEKDKQIPLMRDIYTGATQVIARLGDGRDSDLVDDFIIQLIYCRAELIRKYGNEVSPSDKWPSIAPKDQVRWQALMSFVVNEFWDRTWIIQEIVLPERVFVSYGNSYIPWNLLAFLTVCDIQYGMQKAGDHSIRPFFETSKSLAILRAISFLRVQYHEQKTRLPIFDLTFRCAYSKVTFPQDKIYALLGMSQDLPKGTLQPDHRCIPCEIFTDATIYSLDSGSFALLCLAGHSGDGENPSFPSWVPDLSTGADMYGMVSEIIAGNAYNAGTQSNIQFNVLPDKKHLQIRGVLLDTITECCGDSPYQSFLLQHLKNKTWPTWNELNSQQRNHWVQTFSEISPLAEKHVPDLYIGGLPRTEALWRTVIRDSDGTSQPADHTFVLGCADLAEHLGRFLTEGDARVTSQISQQQNCYARLCDTFTNKFAVTESGLMAMVPLGARKGDVLGVFDGAEFPFVLRPDQTGDTYVLWGAAYVHGFMNGEAMQRKKMWFTLR
jgi:hypothetical protein